MLKIEKGIPIPSGETLSLCATFRQMEIGDSFVFPKERRNSLHSSAAQARVSIKTQRENDKEIRVWVVGKLEKK